MASKPDADGPRIAQAAAEWVTRRDRGLSADEAASLATWEQASPRHRAALAQAEAAWRGLGRLRGVDRVEAMADDVVRRARRRQGRRRMRRWGTFFLGMAAAVTLGFMGWQRLDSEPRAMPPPLHESVQVLASSMRSEVLPDGSIAELNGTSRIEVSYSATARHVRLLSGEAHFIVAKNPDRPFYVSAGPVTVRAVGTAFNVRLASAEIEVLVTEGKVQLERDAPVSRHEVATEVGSALTVGQRALIDRTTATPSAIEVGTVGPTEIEEVLAWQGTRLVFNGTTLDEVVATFNRYNHHRLTLGDRKLRERTLTGTFRADNLEGFLRLARHMVDVKAELRTPHETVLLPAR